MKKNFKEMNLQFFAMKNLDVLQAKKTEIMTQLNQAIKDGDEVKFAEAFTSFSENIQEAVTEEARELIQSVDTNVLAGRGVRQLTTKEKEYYQKVIVAMKSSNPQQALTDLDVVMPVTTIDAVFEDLETEHKLLKAIKFQNTNGLIEFIVNTNGKQLATWSKLTAAIVTELTSGFKKINMGLNKLSAFLPISKAMLDLGPVWIDRYVRAILSESIAFGLEEAIINGTGKEMPIGMTRQVGENVTVIGGEHPIKDTVIVKTLDPITYGALVGKMAVDPKDNARVVNEVIMIVNPKDYLTKVMPATTVRNANGTYVNNVFPFPTSVIQSAQMDEGKAIFGLGEKYFMAIGTAQSGKIEYSDEYRFLEDERVYLVKLYGHGEPLDNNAFILADISNLKPTIQEVKVTNIDEFPSV